MLLEETVLVGVGGHDEDVLDGLGHLLGKSSNDVGELGGIGGDLLQRENLLCLGKPNPGFIFPERSKFDSDGADGVRLRCVWHGGKGEGVLEQRRELDHT